MLHDAGVALPLDSGRVVHGDVKGENVLVGAAPGVA